MSVIYDISLIHLVTFINLGSLIFIDSIDWLYKIGDFSLFKAFAIILVVWTLVIMIFSTEYFTFVSQELITFAP